MLWNAMIGGVNDLVSDLVRGPRDAAELLHDVVQSRAMLHDEALDILQEERSGSFRGQCCNNVIYQESAAQLVTHALPRTHRRKRLARKAGDVEVVVWKFVGVPPGDVLEHQFGSGVALVAHANHPPAGPIHLASGDHPVLTRQPEVVEHVRQGLETGTFRDDTDSPLRASLLQWKRRRRRHATVR